MIKVGPVSFGLAIFLLVVVVSVLPASAADEKRVVCYFASWATYRFGEGTFDVETIDPFLCTHVIYAFAGLGTDHKLKVLDEYNDLEENFGKGAMKRFTGLKSQNPQLKTLLAIGGWNDGSEQYSEMVSTAENRRIFIDSVIPFLQSQGFDGLDLDWEYPTQRGGKPEDRENFDILLGELKIELNQLGLLLTAAIGADEELIKMAYVVENFGAHLDFVNVMTFDYHSPAFEAFTHHHSPLYAHDQDSVHYNTSLNIDNTMSLLVRLGAPAEKLTMGFATYGNGWTLADAESHDIYSTAYQGISADLILQVSGTWAYSTICKRIPGENWDVVRQEGAITSPWAYKDSNWIGYDDVQSVQTKAKYIQDNGLGGGMFWAIDTDDFHGNCGGQAFPLISALKQALKK